MTASQLKNMNELLEHMDGPVVRRSLNWEKE